MNKLLLKDDYEEPRCLLNMHPEVTAIPVGRMLDKLDSYLNQKDYNAAERHLRYWLAEADAGFDMRGKLTVLNEQIGLYRKIGNEEKCLVAISDVLSLADSMDMEQSITYGTTLVNSATGYNAFGKTKDAIFLYRKAQRIYESTLDSYDAKLGGLYNNMATTLTSLGEYQEANNLYNKAIDVMKRQENGALEIAITYLNIADLVAAEFGLEDGEKQIEEQLLKAEKLLNDKELPRDGYYAFVCEKCAPVFGYYGYFTIEHELKERAKDIYERT